MTIKVVERMSDIKKEVKEVVQASSSLFSEAAQMAYTATERVTKTVEKAK